MRARDTVRVSDRELLRAGALDADESLDRSAREAFAGWPMVIGWAGMLVFAFYACTHMVAAGDTWVAMACGRHFVHHGVDTVEPFSANSHSAGPTPEEVEGWPRWGQWITDKVGLDTVRYWHPTGWVNQNWLTHVIFYRLTTGLGSESEPYYDALVLWKFAIYILAAVAVYFTARLYGVNLALAVIAVCASLFIGRTFFDIRPAGFSNLLVAVLILVMALASYRNALYIWLIVPLTIFWSNVHGGYIYAFIILIPFIAWHAIMNLPRRWMIAAYGILLWLVLYGLAWRFLSHEQLNSVVPWRDGMFYMVVLGIGGSVALAINRRVQDGSIVAYHAVVSCALFLLILLRFFPTLPMAMSRRDRHMLDVYISGSQWAYFGIFSLAMIVGAVVVSLKEKVVQVLDYRGITHVLAACGAAFVGMVLFNPFRLTNLTHTFVISVSKHAERWRDVHEWHRAFDWANPVGTAKPFLVLYILAWLILIVWAVAFVYTSRVTSAPVKRKARAAMDYAWPRMDLGLLIVAAMTIYMAIRSRRFIPIAAFAACPILALLVDQMVRVIAAIRRAAQTGRLEVPSLPAPWRRGIAIAGGIIVLAFGASWGTRFYRVYLDYWPADTTYTSVFMRMTASDAKPFAACQFIRENRLSGKIFNYWTEGGFIAWGQEPDPQTGKVPLQLFMDGRAQAAYDVATFDLWSDIMSGGPAATPSLIARRRPTRNESIQIGEWVSEQLREHNVWVVLMPTGQFDKPFVLGLEYATDWRIAYMDDRQKLFVDIASAQGKQLFDGIFTGRTVYPDEYSAKLTAGYNLLLTPEAAQRRQGLELLIEALNEHLAPAPLLYMLTIGTQFPDLLPRIDEMCEYYVRDFESNRDAYAGRHGYNTRLEAIRLALILRRETARASGDTETVEEYVRRLELHDAERERVLLMRW